MLLTRRRATCIGSSRGWGPPCFGSPVRAGDKIFVVDTEGVVICLAADKEFKELGRTELKELSRSTPAIAGGRMYVRTVSHLCRSAGH